MDGVTILSQGTKDMKVGIAYYFDPNILSFIGLMIIIGLTIVLCLFLKYIIETHSYNIIYILFLILLLIFIFIDLTFEHPVIKIVPQYKVTVEKTVSLIDFYDKYIILDQDGAIFTIIDKDWENINYIEVLK